MSLGTGAIQGWWGPAQMPGTEGRFHGNPVSGNQPCKQPPTKSEAATWFNKLLRESYPERQKALLGIIDWGMDNQE